MKKVNIGLIGLAVMGENLALNIESKGFRVAVFNRTTSKVDQFMADRAKGKNFIGTKSLTELVNSIEVPRKILILVQAGAPVDRMIERLIPNLSEGDLIVDCGNSRFSDTIRRNKFLEEHNILFVGAGVSGGEEGALKGPSIMTGGSRSAYEMIEPIFSKIAKKVDDIPCSAYMGSNGAGHYVKMVHNGIEYGDMQLIAESYVLMKQLLGMSAVEIGDTFRQWNKGVLNSYLIEITAEILSHVDNSGVPLVDRILDQAAQKGTGMWTGISALALGVPIPTIVEAVFARSISVLRDERHYASKILKGPEHKFSGDKSEFLEAIHSALYASKICSYAQGFALIRSASISHNWQLDLRNVSLCWRGGCIIRARFLNRIAEALELDPKLPNLLLDDYFRDVVESTQKEWRQVIGTAIEFGIPVPALSSAIAYLDSYRSEHLPANLIQAQRDYFGAHTYLRVDQDGKVVVDEKGDSIRFHTRWQVEGKPEIVVKNN